MIVVGGSYLEVCTVPPWRRIFGSGMRGAAAIGALSPGSVLHTYAFRDRVSDVERSMEAFHVEVHARPIDEDISFSYFHPMSCPHLYPTVPVRQTALRVAGDVVLRFGFVEGDAIVEAARVIYDPQGGDDFTPFRANGSRAQRLAVVLNEAEAAATVPAGKGAGAVGHVLLEKHAAEVVVIKQGCKGALVFQRERDPVAVPVYRSERVFKIGSGDVFSAAFAHFWGELDFDPITAADYASRSVAHFVDYHSLPLPPPEDFAATTSLQAGISPGQVYLAGPFFDLAQRWLIEEACDCLARLGVQVFSPLHDVGTGGSADQIAAADLEGLDKCSAVLALLDGADPGSLFEVGYARARGKAVVILAERLDEPHLTMLRGTGCEVVQDLTTALYRVAWAAMA